MKTSLFIFLFALTVSCQQQRAGEKLQEQPVIDHHSLAEPFKAIARHLDLDITVDFARQQISGKAAWTINNLSQGNQIIFDTKDIVIQKVTLGKEEAPAAFSLGKSNAPFMGQPLQVAIEKATTLVNIYYTTSENAGALQWLQPPQTAGKKKPFLFTQSQPILARSWVPCQDGPAVRFTYNATVKVPADLLALMSAENPQQKNTQGLYHFKQTHPIPAYLMALAVGDLSFKAIDGRTGIYAEPAMLDKAVYEFADMGKMVDAAEKIYGRYRWGRYDVLVLPPSFPYGGMENPNLTFATPTVIAGDRSLVGLIAHELAHSWSGNLVTNATWDDMWLNEGFTTYFEQRIIEALYGKDEADMREVLSRQDLQKDVAALGDTSADTQLKTNFKDRNPDLVGSGIPYDKGYAFLRTIESVVSRPKFDAFLKAWFDANAFQSRTTEQFLTYLRQQFETNDSAFEKKVQVNDWVYKPGVPLNIAQAASPVFGQLDNIEIEWNANRKSEGLSAFINTTNKRLYFLSHLPSTITLADMASLDKEFKFTQSGNAEVQAAWYVLAIRHQYAVANTYIENFLNRVGRRKFLLPLYKELMKTPDGKIWAKKVYATARQNYHPIAIGSIDALLNL